MWQWAWCYCFWLGRKPIRRLWMAATIHHWSYPRCTAKNCWHSIDVHFQNWALTVWFTLLPRMDVSMLVMDSTDHVTIQLPYLQHSKSLTLRWRSAPGWGNKHDAIIFSLEVSHCLIYEWLQPFSNEVTQGAQPEIVDPLLTLIFRMAQSPCGSLCCQKRLPICWLWIAPTTSPGIYLTYKTKNLWRSVEAHFLDGAWSKMILFLAWKAANTSCMNGCNHSPLRLRKMHS